MNNKNLPPFYVGQKVVYITGNNMPKDSIHIVTKIRQDDCGCWTIGINNQPFWFDPADDECTHWNCVECKREYPITYENSFFGWQATSFRPLQEQSFPLITYSKVLEEVPACAN